MYDSFRMRQEQLHVVSVLLEKRREQIEGVVVGELLAGEALLLKGVGELQPGGHVVGVVNDLAAKQLDLSAQCINELLDSLAIVRLGDQVTSDHIECSAVLGDGVVEAVRRGIETDEGTVGGQIGRIERKGPAGAIHGFGGSVKAVERDRQVDQRLAARLSRGQSHLRSR